MLKQGLKALGQSLLIVTGVGYGVIKALDAFETNFPESAPEPERPKPQTDDVTLKRLDGRLVDLDERLIRMEKSLEALITPRPKQPGPKQPSEDFVTRQEMNAAMERLSGAVDSNIERRFEVQNRSVQSLRTMVARTDELLEQLLESIESSSIPA